MRTVILKTKPIRKYVKAVGVIWNTSMTEREKGDNDNDNIEYDEEDED